jgi:alpha-L-rhamnosidase
MPNDISGTNGDWRSTGTAAMVTAFDVAGPDRLRPVELRTELMRDPIGIDLEKPRLSWLLIGNGRQIAYQILVASSLGLLTDEADIWNSGRVLSDQSAHVQYGGRRLSARSQYVWIVRVWDESNTASSWSEVGRWEMGLMTEWAGRWIGGPEAATPQLTLDEAHWIWYPEGDPTDEVPAMTRYFRRLLELPRNPQLHRARMFLAVDDRFVLWSNGIKLAETAPKTSWMDGRVIDMTEVLQSGASNVLAIEATNAFPSPAGVICQILIEFETGLPLIINSDDHFLTSKHKNAGWQSTYFDDSNWQRARKLVPYGQGPWGRRVSDAETIIAAPLLCREFNIPKAVRLARLHVAGVGYHEVELNGTKVSDHVLSPAPTSYDKRVLFVVHDVTGLLQPGSNVIGAELGRGFFGERVRTAWDWTVASWHGEPRLLAQLEIIYWDGTRDTVSTDDQWLCIDGPTRSDSVYAGETYDARLARLGWSLPGHDRSDWHPVSQLPAPDGRLVLQKVQPIQVVEAITPIAITQPATGVYVFDLGKTLGGWIELSVQSSKSTVISLQYAQQLRSDGTVDDDQTYVHGGRFQCDEYRIREGQSHELWRPRFSHKSFRYVQVTGLQYKPERDLLIGQEVRTAAPLTSSFSCSNELYNRIHQMVVASTAHHMLGIPAVDVMYEKIGWTADGHLNLGSFALNFDSQAFLTKWLDDIGDSQRPDGLLPVIAPSGGWGYNWRAPEWTAAYPIVMWEVYWRYGDKTVLEMHYDGVRRYVDWSLKRLDDDGLAVSSLGDWLAPGGSQPPEDRRLTASAYLCRSMQILVSAASVLGRVDDQKLYSHRFERMRNLLNETFFDKTMGVYTTSSDDCYRQTSNLIPLAFDLAPKDQRPRIANSIVSDIVSRDNHLNTGALGTAVLLPILCDTGYEETAHAVASQRTYPSWGYWVDHGADTLWETWELDNSDQGRPPSHDHYLFGSIDRWFFEYILGITPLQPGYKHTKILPHVGGGLEHAAGQIKTTYGAISVRWRHNRDDGTIELHVDIPANTTAEAHLPRPSQGDSSLGINCLADEFTEATPMGRGGFRLAAGRHTLLGRLI